MHSRTRWSDKLLGLPGHVDVLIGSRHREALYQHERICIPVLPVARGNRPRTAPSPAWSHVNVEGAGSRLESADWPRGAGGGWSPAGNALLRLVRLIPDMCRAYDPLPGTWIAWTYLRLLAAGALVYTDGLLCMILAHVVLSIR